MSELVVVKLGGSVITEKDEPETFDEAALSTAAASIARYDGSLVIVHGAGSFGHLHADRHGLTRSRGTRDAAAAYDVHDAMRRLNDAVIGALHGHDVQALPVHPLSAGSRDADGALVYPIDAVRTMLDEEFVPVAHGDGIVHADNGVTVLSGDELATVLAGSLGADRLGLCSAVPGVLDADGAVIDRIEEYEDVADALGEPDGTDVTGGMAAKVEGLLEFETPARIFDLKGLGAFLDGGSPGTLVD